jgi:hypothetical protein
MGNRAKLKAEADQSQVARMLDCTCQLADIPPARTRALSASWRRALQIRLEALEAEQSAAAAEIEALYQRSNKLTLEVLERQQRLRQFREILLNGRAA